MKSPWPRASFLHSSSRSGWNTDQRLEHGRDEPYPCGGRRPHRGEEGGSGVRAGSPDTECAGRSVPAFIADARDAAVCHRQCRRRRPSPSKGCGRKKRKGWGGGGWGGFEVVRLLVLACTGERSAVTVFSQLGLLQSLPSLDSSAGKEGMEGGTSCEGKVVLKESKVAAAWPGGPGFQSPQVCAR